MAENAYAIIARVVKDLRREGRHDLAEEYLRKAKSGDYANLLKVSLEFSNEATIYNFSVLDEIAKL